MNDRAETTVLYKHGGESLQVQRNDLESNSEENNRWGALLTFVGITTTIGSAIPVGYNIGVINSPATYMRTWCNETLIARFDIYLEVEMLDILWSAIVSIFLVGGAVGSLGGAWVADKRGRKEAFIITSVLFFVGAACFQFCRSFDSIEMLLLGRFLVGLASGLCTSTLPMYLTELAPLKLRGTFGTFCAIGVTGGVVVGQIFSLQYVLGTEYQWHNALSFYVLLVLLCSVPVYYFPESPKWVFNQGGDREAARTILEKLRGYNNNLINQELNEMENARGNTTRTMSFCSTLKNPNLLMPLIIVCAYMGGQQLSGINAIFYYSVLIFENAGLSKTNAELANLGAGCVNLLTSLLGPYLMTKFNRRPLMLFSCGIDAIILFIIAFIIYFINASNWLSNACIAAIFLYIFFYQFGLGPIPYFIGSEIFETDSRPVGMAMGSLSSWVCNFIIGMTFPSLQRLWDAFVFLPFSLTCVLLYFLTKYYLPETRNRDVSEIAPSLSKGFRSKPLI